MFTAVSSYGEEAERSASVISSGLVTPVWLLCRAFNQSIFDRMTYTRAAPPATLHWEYFSVSRWNRRDKGPKNVPLGRPEL